MVQTSDVAWTNAVSDTKLGQRVPALIRVFSLMPAGTHRGKTATEMVRGALARGVQIQDVVVDPGYSLAKPEHFVLPVRREGIHVTFRPASHQWKPEPHTDDAITIGGQLFYAAVPEKLLDLKMPPMGATMEEKRRYESKFNERAIFRVPPPRQPGPDGTTRWQSPFAAGSPRRPRNSWPSRSRLELRHLSELTADVEPGDLREHQAPSNVACRVARSRCASRAISAQARSSNPGDGGSSRTRTWKTRGRRIASDATMCSQISAGDHSSSFRRRWRRSPAWMSNCSAHGVRLRVARSALRPSWTLSSRSPGADGRQRQRMPVKRRRESGVLVPTASRSGRHSGSQWGAPSGKLSGSPCWLITASKPKDEKSAAAVNRATKPLFSLAGPRPDREK
jgi:hypothetical protein